MKLKLFLTGLFIIISVMVMKAEEEASHYLHIQDEAGWSVLNLDSVDRLLFSDGNMSALDKNRNVLGTYPQSHLKTLYVDENADLSQIKDLFADEKVDASFILGDNGLVTLLADGEFSVYDINGSLLVYIEGARAQQTIDLSAISEDILILKSGNYAIKAVRK